MSEDKKRFPWWLVVCAAVLMLLAVVLGFIETVGRQGTIGGRYEQIRKRMSPEELVAIMGKPDEQDFHRHTDWSYEEYTYRDGPATATITLSVPDALSPIGPPMRDWVVVHKELAVDGAGSTWWRARRWAEQAYTAIHGPRR